MGTEFEFEMCFRASSTCCKSNKNIYQHKLMSMCEERYIEFRMNKRGKRRKGLFVGDEKNK